MVDLQVAVGGFRQDVYFRLNGISVTIPPLRDRTDEIEPLARLFLSRLCAVEDRSPEPTLSRESLDILRAHPWPGNIRELRNTVERAVILCPDDTILPEHLVIQTPALRGPAASGPTDDESAQDGQLRAGMEDFERQRIEEALTASSGNQTAAAKLLGISRSSLVRRLSQYGISRPRKTGDDS